MDKLDLTPLVEGSYLPQIAMQYAEELVIETSKLILTVDKRNLKIVGQEPQPSKLAPEYIHDIVKHPERIKDDESSSTTPFDSTNSRSFEELQMFRKNLQDEDRLANMYKLKHNFSFRFDNRAWLHPHGTTNFDYQGIPKRRQVIVERFKNRVRRDNYRYLGLHPEIQAMISLFLKRLLVAQPQDGAEYLAEYFSTQMKYRSEFEEKVKAEMQKISRYHVTKMKAAGKINIRPSTAVRSESVGEEWTPEMDANFFKKMNIGPLAAEFSFDPSCLMALKKKNDAEAARKKLRRKKKKPYKYCGCKDWKLKKNRVGTADTEGGRTSITFSTLGNVDTLPSSEEDETEAEDEEEEGEFVGWLGDEEEELLPEEAERIASQLVDEFLNPDGGVYGGHHRSLGNVKNIQ